MKVTEEIFRLNGEEFSKEQLISLAFKKIESPTTALWEKDIFHFIIDWFGNNSFIVSSTSGSTGTPKEIKLPKASMKYSAQLTASYFNLKKNENALLCMSTKYIAGKMMVVRAFTIGMNLIYIEPTSFPVKDLDEKIDFAAMVPLQVQKSLTNKYNFNKIKTLIIGGSTVSVDLIKKLQYVSTQSYATYGMTETVSHIAIMKLTEDIADAKFNALDDIEFDITDKDCLIIKAPKILDQDLITNDIVNLKSKTEFEWIGRIDNIINSGGIKLVPEEIEKKLSKLIYRRYFISSLADETLGNKIILFVEGRRLDDECMDRFRNRITNACEKFENPKQIIFLPEFAETETGKVKRKETLENYLQKQSIG